MNQLLIIKSWKIKVLYKTDTNILPINFHKKAIHTTKFLDFACIKLKVALCQKGLLSRQIHCILVGMKSKTLKVELLVSYTAKYLLSQEKSRTMFFEARTPFFLEFLFFYIWFTISFCKKKMIFNAKKNLVTKHMRPN